MDKKKGSINYEEYERIFRDAYPRLYYFALNLLKEEEISKDIVNDAFVAVWNNRTKINKGKIIGYLYSTIKNKSLNYIANSHKFRTYININELNIYDTDPEYWIEREKLILELEKEIDKMPARTQYVLRQCYLKEHTYKDVAKELGITTDGVKKHIVKALSTLRKHFNKDKH